MTTVTITGTVSSYSLNSPVTTLIVAKSGYVGGQGITGGSSGAYTIVNSGRVATYSNTSGIYLRDGGVVNNGGGTDTTAEVIGRYSGVKFSGGGTVNNSGTITDEAYGDVVNGAIYFINGTGTVTNGSGVDIHALIEGGDGVFFRGGVGTLANFGAIIGNGLVNSVGAYLYDGGSLTNGSLSDKTALVEGMNAVYDRSHSALTVANFGTILGTGASGVRSLYGGSVTNGAAGDTTALISGDSGVAIYGAPGTITNFGTILGPEGQYGRGVVIDGGVVTNGSATDRTALIEGYLGVGIYVGVGTLTNNGTIEAIGGSHHFGVVQSGGGVLTNGAVNNTEALIEGYGGINLYGGATGANFGTVQALGGDDFGTGLELSGGSVFRNGSSTDKTALITGYLGASISNNSTLINYGTLSGAGSAAVQLDPTSTLVVEAHSAFIGYINANGGTIADASAAGAFTFYYGAVTLPDATPGSTFFNVGQLVIDQGVTATLSGGGSVGFEETLDVAGVVSAAGTISDFYGMVAVSGTLSGSGLLNLSVGGQADFFTGADIAIAKVNEDANNASAYFEGTGITVTDVWAQSLGLITVATGDKVSFSGTGDTFSGTLAGAGTVDFTGGTDALTGTKVTAAAGISGTGTVTFSGNIDLTSTMTVSSPNLVIATTGATLSGGGILSLSNLATNAIKGASATAKLTNSDTIKGAGQLGDGEMELSNAAGGIIQANEPTALVINLGANTLANAGTIENTSTGGLTITGAVSNTDLLEVTAGTLAVDGAVSGSGTVKISGGTADFGSTFVENVSFTTTGGVLELADATTYTGEITGFAKTTVSSLDLTDINFVSGTTKATFSGTTTSGVLTVTDGTHTAKITLEGNYTTSTFTVASDGHGGTTVTDPPKSVAATPPPQPWRIGPEPVVSHPLVTAMAGFGAGSADEAHIGHAETGRATLMSLASPTVAAV